MKNVKQRAVGRYVLCVSNSGYEASLELMKLYRMLGEERAGRARFLRIVDESGADYLFPAGLFRAIEIPRSVHRVLSAAVVRAA